MIYNLIRNQVIDRVFSLLIESFTGLVTNIDYLFCIKIEISSNKLK